MARPRIEVTSNQARSMVAKYKKGVGMKGLAGQFACTVHAVRRVLVDAGVAIRGRGRPVAV